MRWTPLFFSPPLSTPLPHTNRSNNQMEIAILVNATTVHYKFYLWCCSAWHVQQFSSLATMCGVLMKLLLACLLALLYHAGVATCLCHPTPMNCTKNLLIFSTPDHRCGLTNQLIMLRAMLLVADLLNRDLFVEKLSSSIGLNAEKISFCSMIDVEGTNAIFLKNKNIRSKFCTGTDIINKTGANPKTMSMVIDQRTGKIRPTDASSQPYLFLAETPLWLGLGLLYNPHAHKEDLRFKFAPLFYNLAEEFKSIAKIDKYNAVHFRVEDDWLDHVFAKFYTDTKVFKSLIYCYLYYYVAVIASNLDTSMPLLVAVGSNTRHLPFALSYLRLYFPRVIVTPKRGTFRARGYPEGRALYAAVDMILISDCVNFIGHQGSTFSAEIVNNRISAGKRDSLYFNFDAKFGGDYPELFNYFDTWNEAAVIPPPSGIEGLLNVSLFVKPPLRQKDFPYEKFKHSQEKLSSKMYTLYD